MTVSPIYTTAPTQDLAEEQKAVLKAFIRLPRRSRVGKMAEILRWGFTKNTWLRTLGQMMMIGD